MRRSDNACRAAFSSWLSLAACVALAWAVLAAAWITAQSSPFLIGGLLPVSDALGFMFSGLHALYAGALDVTGARRPLAAIYSAGRLLAGGQSFQGAMLFQATLLGGAGWLFARELWRAHGPAAGLTGFALALAVVYPNIATGLSDTGGVIFGLTAFALMWRAVTLQSWALYAWGVFILTMGLAIRPGDFALLPLSVLFAAGFFAGRRAAATGGALVAGLAGIAAAFAAGALFGDPRGMPQANFYYTLYGMSVGQDWAAAFRDIPDLAARLESEGERIVAIHVRDIALHNILTAPGPFIGRFADNLAGWLLSTPLVGFLGHTGPRSGLTAALCVTTLLLWRRGPHEKLTAVGVASTLLSAGISYGDGGWKAALTASPFWIAAIVLPLAWLTRRNADPAASRFGRDRDPQAGTLLLVGFGGGLALLATLLPAGFIASGVLHPQPPQPRAVCDGGRGGIILRAGYPGAVLHVVDDALPFSFAPAVRVSDFRRNLLASGNEFAALLADVPAGKKIIYAYDVTQDPDLKPVMRLVVAVADETLALPAGGYVALCGDMRRATEWATGPRLMTNVATAPISSMTQGAAGAM